MNGRDTMQFEPVRKGSKIKDWAPIITAALALVGSIFVAVMQSSNASKEQIAVSFDQVENHNKNNNNKLEDAINEIRVILAKQEAYIEILQDEVKELRKKTSRMRISSESLPIELPKPKPRSFKKFDLPDLKVQQFLK